MLPDKKKVASAEGAAKDVPGPDASPEWSRSPHGRNDEMRKAPVEISKPARSKIRAGLIDEVEPPPFIFYAADKRRPRETPFVIQPKPIADKKKKK